MTEQAGREKAEEWLAVCRDFADDLLVSHGEEAVEAFWGTLDARFYARQMRPWLEAVRERRAQTPGLYERALETLRRDDHQLDAASYLATGLSSAAPSEARGT